SDALAYTRKFEGFVKSALFFALPIMAGAVDPVAYVLNTNGETLSKISLYTGAVNNNIVVIGSDADCYPNQIVIRDTLAYVIASGTDEIQIVNLNTEQSLGFINTGAFSNPYWMDFYDSRYLYVTLQLNNSLAKIDVIDRKKLIEIPVGLSPAGLAITNNKVYVANSRYDYGTGGWESPGTVSVLDAVSGMIIKTIEVDLNPQFMAVDDLGRVHVVCTGDYYTVPGVVNVIDPVGDTVVASLVTGGSPGQISIGPDHTAYLAAAGWTSAGFVYTYNALTLQAYHISGNPIEVDWNCMTAVAYQDSTCFTGSFTDYINVIDSAGVNQGRYAVGSGPIHIDFNYLPGDATGDFAVDLLDILLLIDWIYNEGPPPAYPLWRGNANGDDAYNLLDILHLISYVYSEGARPVAGPRWVR
ncbi:MAG: hypothetical protein JSV44_10270, partial [Candidatus Zixiibacteriota bacterium]